MSGHLEQSSRTETPFVPLLEVLTSLRVEGALFTTYTLSLTWFEQYVLRSLERNGAREVVLLADPRGVADSVQEGLASGPGIRYALESVDLANGAFHPKVIMLWSKAQILIAVGSGNLTFAGMGRNLENWDVLVAGVEDAHPKRQLTRRVATAAIGFLERLKGVAKSGGRGGAVLDRAHAVFNEWTPRLPVGDDDLRWLDSTTSSIGDQLSDVLPAPRGPRRLQVLSPFHADDGASVTLLAESLGASELDILYTNGSTAFPLSAGRPAEFAVQALELQVGGSGQPLHGKVIRVVDADREYLLSGSANATWQALWTTNNVEVCLLRSGERGCFERLLPVQPGAPEFTPNSFPTSEPRVFSIAWARASTGGVDVKVVWRSKSDPEQAVACFIGDREESVSVAWSESGLLKLPMPSEFNLLRPRALRVELRVASHGVLHISRAWIAFDELLDASPEYRVAMHAWSRLMSGDQGPPDEDDAVLLHIFAEEHAHIFRTGFFGGNRNHEAGQQGEGHPAGDEPQQDDRPVPLRLLDALAIHEFSTPLRTTDQQSVSAIDLARGAMIAAFRRIEKKRPGGVEPRDEADGSDTSEPTPRLRKGVREALVTFQEQFVAEARSLTGSARDSAATLAYALLCARMAAYFWLLDGEDRNGFWRSIDSVARTILCPREECGQGPLISVLVRGPDDLPEDGADWLALLLALLDWREHGGRLEGEDTVSPSDLLHGDALRQAVATLDAVADSARLPMPRIAEYLAPIFPENPAVLVDAFDELRRRPAPGDRLVRLMEIIGRLRTPGLEVPADLEESDREVLASVRAGRDPVRVFPWARVCPKCFREISREVSQTLIKLEPARCSTVGCLRWLLPVSGLAVGVNGGTGAAV